ncbi:uncharacterized protein LOC111024499 [Momordica charantia]|uniref:Uncharacterized protein LOC111024499 n=1 Tax=Momordica charantia TaxID=3673 RepID=A0A6J1DZG7_MOMCH|nr:uncharacterized protein LOC111024499 [Momordica charantia]
MAILIKTFKAFAAIAVLGMLLSSKDNITVYGQCKGNMEDMVARCGNVAQIGAPEEDPSPACCNAVSTADVRCMCQHMTAEAERVLDMSKVVHVADFCGNPIPHGSKCGSYTVP